MKKSVFTVIFCLLLCLQAYGQTSYTITGSDNDLTLTITGTGNMPNYSSFLSVPWYSQSMNIKTVIIENGVTSIGDFAFIYCRFTSITIPESVTSIGIGAFQSCHSLVSIAIPKSITNIESSAFTACDNLVSIDVSSENIDYSSEDGVLFNKNKTTLIRYPAKKAGKYNIPESTTNIKESAFYNCSGLTSITIPSGIKSIGASAFSGCRLLSSAIIPEGVTSIGMGTFNDCNSLTSVTIPQSVVNIETESFVGCRNLTSIICFNSTPVSISPYVFIAQQNIGVDKSACTLYVPTDSKTEYEKTDVWKEFSIVELPALSEIIETPTADGALIEWQTYENAEGYKLIIHSDEALSDTLYIFEFDATGELLRSASTNLSHTIENLQSGTDYFYTLEILGISGVVLASQSGKFTTSETTSIDVSLAKPAETAIVGYYSVLGEKLPQEPKKGLYLILYSNGKAEKIIKK